MSNKVLIIGAGVSGLTTAYVLLQAGWQVTICAAHFSKIVSCVAAAIWEPYQAKHEKSLAWAQRSKQRFEELRSTSETGISIITSRKLHRNKCDPPEWANMVDNLRSLEKHELSNDFVCGYSYDTLLIETPIYFPWLAGEVQNLGGVLEQRVIRSIGEVVKKWPIVINCTGLGAEKLIGDDAMKPIRGQLVKIEASITDTCFFDEDEDVTYIIPRSDGTLLGGTLGEDDYNEQECKQTTKDIIDRTSQLFPEIATAKVIEPIIGLRPGRKKIRLQAEKMKDSIVIHNYGHGGSGYTLSWGCAYEVLQLLESFFRE